MTSFARSTGMTRAAVVVLTVAYFPFLLAVIGGTGYAAYWIASLAWTVGGNFNVRAGVLLLIPAVLLGCMALALLAAPAAFFARAEMRDPLELRLPQRGMKGLLRLVRGVAERQSLPAPDEVRLHAASVAHVYEEGTARILVIGGAALASLDRKALSGVIAHELGHFAGGDTAVSRRAVRWHQAMGRVEQVLIDTPWNPLGWLLRGYHLVYRLAWAAGERAREYRADRHEVATVGSTVAARTLIALSSIDEMPWARLTAVAEWFAIMPSRDASVFGEQVRRARHTTASEWEAACRRALKRRTGAFDSHPCLRDRLRSIGVSPKEAIGMAAKRRPNEADPSEYIPDWDAIDGAMSAFLIELVQQVQQSKRELASIVLGRPVG